MNLVSLFKGQCDRCVKPTLLVVLGVNVGTGTLDTHHKRVKGFDSVESNPLTVIRLSVAML